MLFNNIKEHTTYKPLELHKGKKVDLHFHTIQLLQFSVFSSSFHQQDNLNPFKTMMLILGLFEYGSYFFQ